MAIPVKNERCPTILNPPIRLPLRNVSTTAQSLRRGIALSIGYPPQILSFKVNAALNVTHIHDTSGSCSDPDDPLQCNALRGGRFSIANSSSWHDAVGFGSPDLKVSNARYGNDTVHINSSYSLAEFPFGLVGTEKINEIGLGHSSILLQSLVSASSITSNVWGYHQGSMSFETTDQLDGSLLLGGYDEAKITGNNLTVPFTNDPSCSSRMAVTISDITMNLANGSDVSIIGASKGALKSCILPEITSSTLPQDIWASFVRVSGITETGRATGQYLDGKLISANGSYDGNLTINLGSNFEITIPNHQLVLPNYSIDELGQTVIHNTTSREIYIDSLNGAESYGMLTLGQSFLTSAYLFVDNDLEKFTLWRINATERENLIAVPAASCRDDLSKSNMSTNSPTLPPTTATPSSLASSIMTSAASDAPTGSRETISHGAYVAIALSAIFLSCLLVGGLLYWKQRRARRRGIQRQEINTRNGNSRDRLTLNFLHRMPELPSDRQPPQEMPISKDPPYILSPYELETIMSNQRKSDPQSPTSKANSVDDGISRGSDRSELE